MNRWYSKIPTFRDALIGARINDIVLDNIDEVELLLNISKTIDSENLDIVYTKNGDSFLLPYLYHRAKINRILKKFNFTKKFLKGGAFMKTTRGQLFLLILCFILIAGMAVWAGGKQETTEETETAAAAAGPKPVYNWIGAVVEIPYFDDSVVRLQGDGLLLQIPNPKQHITVLVLARSTRAV